MPFRPASPAFVLGLFVAAALSCTMAGRASAQDDDAALGEVPGMVPDRLLDCAIGHVTNFDPAHVQTTGELVHDSMHRFVVFLARGKRMVGEPPNALDAPPKVNPRTRIIFDPDHISGQMTPGFTRLVDKWPYRVETAAPIDRRGMLNAIALNPIDEKAGTANLLMVRAAELTHYDPDHIYQGTCRVLTDKAAIEAERSAAAGKR